MDTTFSMKRWDLNYLSSLLLTMTTQASSIWDQTGYRLSNLTTATDEKIKHRGFMIEFYLEDGRQNEPEVFGKIHH